MEFFAAREELFLFKGLVFRIMFSKSHCHSHLLVNVQDLYFDLIIFIVEKPDSINTLRTGLLNSLNARSRGLTFRHRASRI